MKYPVHIIGMLFLLINALPNAFSQEVSLPYTQSFDLVDETVAGALPDDWTNESEGTTDGCVHGATDCHNWDVFSGSTPSSNIGPSGDHTSGSDNYLYVEASGNNNRSVRINTPSFNLSGSNGYLRFWMHTYNGNASEFTEHSFRINILTAANTTIATEIVKFTEQNSTNSWQETTVDLSDYSNSGNIRIQFEWVSISEEYSADFAIDDITIDVCGTSFISLFDADFENTLGDNNWSLTSGASDGNWTIDSPSPYTSGGVQMEIAAHEGSQALITGSTNDQDLDGGPTLATSPDIPIPGTASLVVLNFKYYFSNASNGDNNDNLIIRYYNASNNALLGTAAHQIGKAVNINAVYADISVDLSDHVGVTIYFTASSQDSGGGSKTEAAIDAFNISYCTGVSVSENCLNNNDDDLDGLVDCLDDDCDGNVVCDNDGDLVTDRLDRDDDNDGILDANECYATSNLITNPGFESGNTGFSSDFSFVTCTTDCGPSRDLNRGEYAINNNACGCGGQTSGVQEWTGVPIEGNSFMVLDFNTSGTDVLWRQVVSTTPYIEYSFNVWVLNTNFTNTTDPRIQLAISTDGGTSYTVLGVSSSITEVQGWKQIGFNFINGNNSTLTIAIQNGNSGNTGRDIAIDALSLIPSNCDDDGDGVINQFDLDSDNDGLYDVFESASGQAQSGGVLSGSVDSDGIPNSVSNNSGYINYLPADSDNDGILDGVELDADGDGCYDSFEEQINDPDNDGIAGIGTPTVDGGDGLVTSISYASPSFYVWQDSGEDNPGCDGDTDDDGTPDVDDLDDDNDGIPDIIESPATIDFSGAKTLLVGSDIDNMLVDDVVLYANAIRDCDDIFYDITISISSISPGVIVEADPQGLIIDNAAASDDDHFTFTLNVVEAGSATVSNVAGTAAVINNFLFKPRDIDSNVGIDHTEVFGISNATLPDTIYLDPLTVLEQGGFINGAGAGATYTYYRMIPISGTNDWTANDNDINGELEEFAVFMFYSSFSSISMAYGRTGSALSNDGGRRLTSLFASKECDRDGDGVPNRVDLDLDNDGIFDLYEAGHSYTADLDNDGMIDGSDVGSGPNGLYDSAETSPESDDVNYTYSDSDGDGVLFDFFESDSDGDNCYDTEEADVADADVDGIAGTGTPINNSFGMVTTINYEKPPTANWQNPLQSCLEVCDNGIDDDGDGLIDDFDPDCADYFLEAECGFPGANWVRTFDLGASNNDFQTISTGLNSLSIPPTAGADILRFTVTTSAEGTYRILGRVKSASGADDSFWFRVDEGTWYKWNDWDTGGIWQWIEFADNDDGNNPVRYVLSAGSHSIDLAYREDGAGIDKLHLTINGSTPSGEGEEAINCQRSISTNLFLNYKIKNRNN